MATKISYTSRLVNSLNSSFIGLEGKERDLYDRFITSIREFSSEQKVLIDNKNDKEKGYMTFGKYSGKSINDVYKLDKPYIKWLSKNNKYLNEDSKSIVFDLCNGSL